MPLDWPSWAPLGAMRATPDTYVSMRSGRIRILRDERVIWRSNRPYTHTSAIVAGRDALAFSLFGRGGSLYVARFDGRERVVGHGEDPVAFLSGGRLLTQRWERNRMIVRVRSLNGRLIRVVAPRARTATFDQHTKTLYYVTRNGVVARFDGVRRVGLARLPAAWRWPSLHVLEDGHISVLSDRGLLIVRRSGGVFASAQMRPPTQKRSGYVLDGAITKRTSAVALTSSKRGGWSTMKGEARVSVLRAGARRATIVYRHRVQNFGCGWGTGLAWQGDWLLYTTSATQKVVAIDTSSDRQVDLTSFVRSLPGRATPPTGWKLAFRAEWR